MQHNSSYVGICNQLYKNIKDEIVNILTFFFVSWLIYRYI